MACSSLAKLNAASSQWIGQQSFTQRHGSSTSLSTRRVAVPIRAKAYTDELILTAVRPLLPYFQFITIHTQILLLISSLVKSLNLIITFY